MWRSSYLLAATHEGLNLSESSSGKLAHFWRFEDITITLSGQDEIVVVVGAQGMSCLCPTKRSYVHHDDKEFESTRDALVVIFMAICSQILLLIAPEMSQ